MRLPSTVSVPYPPRTRLGNQFGWFSMISRVSSIETIFSFCGMKIATAFKVVVLPAAVAPANIAEILYWTRNQKKARISGE